jgi:hypothetical protein
MACQVPSTSLPAWKGRQAGAGERAADMGGHVVCPLVVVQVGPQRPATAERAETLFWHQGLQVGREIGEHTSIRVLVDRERAGGVQAEQACLALLHATGNQRPIQLSSDV